MILNIKLSLSKEREIFKSIYNKRFDKIIELIEKNYDNNLEFITTSTEEKKTTLVKKGDP